MNECPMQKELGKIKYKITIPIAFELSSRWKTVCDFVCFVSLCVLHSKKLCVSVCVPVSISFMPVQYKRARYGIDGPAKGAHHAFGVKTRNGEKYRKKTAYL